MSSNDATLPAPTETNDVEIPDAPDPDASTQPTHTTPIDPINGEDTPIADAPPTSDDAAPAPAAKPAPEPVQEEPLGRRAQTLSVFFPKALEKCLSMISYPKLAECFPTLAGARPEVLTRIHASMVENMRGKTTDEFASILHERHVIPKLNSLDLITADAETRAAAGGEPPVAPSTLAPRDVITAHLRPVLRAATERAERQLKDVQEKNDGLIKEIEEQRREMEELVKLLEGRRGEMEMAVGAVEGAVRGVEGRD